ncbi:MULTISPECIES: phage holin family protein [Brevibacterium]|uniref:phage holin family protein n=1 Tax=Brevibacterium TaxID=1696 RepID=UPI001C24E525|nr:MULTISPECIES: phage holin family protein [Brevibacterium]MBU8578630.1 phage holin family protein [Brevibacterium luteolum]MCT1829614.1 phage holin family protein [Brevibacterium luteolum]
MSERSISQLIKDIQADGQALVQEESALAKAEVTEGVKKLGIGAGLAIAGLFLLFLGSLVVTFLLVAVFHEGVGLSWWLSALIVFGILLVLALILVGIAVPFLKKGNPTPQSAISSGKSALNAFKRALSNPSGPRV